VAAQQQQQQQLPAVRQWSSGILGEEGEFVEQLSDPEDPASSSSSSRRAAAGQLLSGAAGSVGADQKAAGSQGLAGSLQRGSPASSSSDDAVLLERE
jgi:hypothetical protein